MSEIIAGVEVPDTVAVAEATRLVQETTSPLIYHHSRRVFFFGQIHAHLLGVKPDPELLYLAAMFHDAGLATPFSDAEQRFEVDGADHGRKFLLERGFSTAAAETVWTAIALHTTPGIPDRMGPEIATTHLGVLTDVLGFGLDGLHTDQVTEILGVHPRGDFKNEFLSAYFDGFKNRPETTNGTVNSTFWSTSSPVSSAQPLSSASSARPGRADRNRRRGHRDECKSLYGRASPRTRCLLQPARLRQRAADGINECALADLPAVPGAVGLSVTILTVVFAVYVAGLVGALLTVGSLSDHLGRRPVLVASLLVAAAGTAIFWAAGGVFSVVLARVVQGIATGTATGALAAGLVEFSPEGRPHVGPTMTAVGTSFGLAIGGGLAGLLVQVSPRPDAEIFPALTLAFVVLVALVFAIPETVVRRAGGLAALRPRIRVPRDTRREFFVALPAIIAVHHRIVPRTRTVAGARRPARPVRRRRRSQHHSAVHRQQRGWTVGGAAPRAKRHLAASGPAVTGRGGFGRCPGLRVPVRLHRWIDRLRAGRGPDVQRGSPWHQRGHHREVAIGGLSAAFVVSYAALGLPSLAAGLAGRSWGLETTSYLYISFIGALSLIATLHAGRHLASRPDQSRPSRLQSPGEAADRRDDRTRRASARTPLSVRETA